MKTPDLLTALRNVCDVRDDVVDDSQASREYAVAAIAAEEARRARAKALIKEWVRPHGHLVGLNPYVNWPSWDGRVELDGEFTAEELRAIADFMEGNGV